MSDFLRKYWFVSLLAVLFIGVLIYFIADMNKDNVKTMSKDGQDIVVSTTAGDVTSSDVYNASQLSSSRFLYNAYRNAVVDQSVEMDSAMEKEAKTMARNIESNIKADSKGETKFSILSQLASFGFTGDSAVEDYARITTKAKKLDTDFIIKNFDKLKDDVPEGARTVSILTMQVDNAEILNDEDTKKKEDINKALESGDFAAAASQYSDDTATKEKGGSFGYIDSASKGLEADVITAAVGLEAGQTSDWITVKPEGAQYYLLYRVHVDETDPQKLIESEDSAVIEAMATSMINSVNGLEALAIQQAAQSLDITYENNDVKEGVENYQNSQTEALAARLGISLESSAKTETDKKGDEKTSETSRSDSKDKTSDSSHSDEDSQSPSTSSQAASEKEGD